MRSSHEPTHMRLHSFCHSPFPSSWRFFRCHHCAVWFARARYTNNTPATAKSVPPGLNNASKNNMNPPLKRVSEAPTDRPRRRSRAHADDVRDSASRFSRLMRRPSIFRERKWERTSCMKPREERVSLESRARSRKDRVKRVCCTLHLRACFPREKHVFPWPLRFVAWRRGYPLGRAKTGK